MPWIHTWLLGQEVVSVRLLEVDQLDRLGVFVRPERHRLLAAQPGDPLLVIAEGTQADDNHVRPVVIDQDVGIEGLEAVTENRDEELAFYLRQCLRSLVHRALISHGRARVRVTDRVTGGVTLGASAVNCLGARDGRRVL